MLKDHNCGELRASHAGQSVALAGWVHRRRDHGGLVFIDLRDHDGLVQVVFHPEESTDAYAVAEECATGVRAARDGPRRQAQRGHGEPEPADGRDRGACASAEVLNAAKTPPFYIVEETDVEELLRLKYRYLDLRRETMHGNIVTRHQVVKFIRDYLAERGFTEIETPMLTTPTPEGARDYLVPSRVHAGHFYALPQSPQQFKQLLMVAGIERYFQIARCLRDEDLRADRQPEFTQLDLEMSFVSDEEDIFQLTEELYYALARGAVPAPEGAVAPVPAHDLRGVDGALRHGQAGPALRPRAGRLRPAWRTASSRCSRDARRPAARSAGSCVPGGAAFCRKQIDELTTFVQGYGAKGLVSMQLAGEGSIDTLTMDDIRSPVAKFFSLEQAKEMARLRRREARRHAADRRGQARRPRTRRSTRCGASWRRGWSWRTTRRWPSPSSRSSRCSSGARRTSAGRRRTTCSPRRSWRTCR